MPCQLRSYSATHCRQCSRELLSRSQPLLAVSRWRWDAVQVRQVAHIRTGSRRQPRRSASGRERQAEKDRIAAEAVARDEEAVARTESIERRVAELENLLRSSLARDPRISFDSLRSHRGRSAARISGRLLIRSRHPNGPTSHPGHPAGCGGYWAAASATRLHSRQPSRRSLVLRMITGNRKPRRQRMVAEARASWARRAAEAKRKAEARNAHVAREGRWLPRARPVCRQRVRADSAGRVPLPRRIPH